MTNNTLTNYGRFFQERKAIELHYADHFSQAREYIRTHVLSHNELDSLNQYMMALFQQYLFQVSVLEASEASHNNPFLPRRGR